MARDARHRGAQTMAGFGFLFVILGGRGIIQQKILLFVFIGAACGSLPALGWGAVALDCPHCGAKTPSNLPECKKCGKSFREKSDVGHPIIDAPKLRP